MRKRSRHHKTKRTARNLLRRGLEFERVEERQLLTVITTNSQVELANFFNPVEPPPLNDITQMAGPQGLGMVYTNQTDGIAGVSGGLRTVTVQLIKSATDGITFPNVVGPNNSGNVLAVTALSGTLLSPGTANFDPNDGGSGKLFLYEQPSGVGFDRRDPASWLTGSTLLTQFDLLGRDDITQGPNGEAIVVAAADVNKSAPFGLLTGDSDITLLWLEDQSVDADFFIAPDPSTPLQGVLDDEKLVTNGEQRAILDAVGQNIDPLNPGLALDASDLSALNSIASAAGLSDLGGAGTGFATGFAMGTQTDFYVDVPSSSSPTQGDLVAQLSSENYPAKNVAEENPEIEIEKTTDGSSNINVPVAGVDSDFDNEDNATTGVGIPVLTPGSDVTWTYQLTNPGTVAIPESDISVDDDELGDLIINGVVQPLVDTEDKGLDATPGTLDPGDVWLYTITSTVEDLATSPIGVPIVAGCDSVPVVSGPRNTYVNNATVTIPGATDSDPSHYCNPDPKIEIEKTTDGSSNTNVPAAGVDSDFDNEDNATTGVGIPVLTPGSDVTWTYQLTNPGTVAIPESDISVDDDELGDLIINGVVQPLVDNEDKGGDASPGFLNPGDVWLYTITSTVEDLATSPIGVPIVTGCDSVPVVSGPRNTYVNNATVTIPGATDSDPSHYCNPDPEIQIEKTTDGSSNTNVPAAGVDSDFDNEDNATTGVGIPVLTPGSDVTWTYQLTNPGTVAIPESDISVDDDELGDLIINGVVQPLVDTENKGGDASPGFLNPGDVWLYTVTSTVEDLGTSPIGVPIVTGCDSVPVVSGPRNTYVNNATVTIPGMTDSDPSHYCNPDPKIEIEKTTDGSSNTNVPAAGVDSDFDNEDNATTGVGIPVLTPGSDVTWTYQLTNPGTVAIPESDISVDDDELGDLIINGVVQPLVDTENKGGDASPGFLNPGDVWLYTITSTVEDLATSPIGVPIVTGCDSVPVVSGPRNTYVNNATVTIPGATDSDPSHYCNPDPKIEIEKTTDGSSNTNVPAAGVDSDFDNEDNATTGVGIPVLTPGSDVTWTYQLTNPGTVAIPEADISVDDDELGDLIINGVVQPLVDTENKGGDASPGFLNPGDVWLYTITSTVEDLATSPIGVPIVIGCDSVPVVSGPRNTYVNNATVTIPGATDSDPSHFCNPDPGIEIEKLTNGVDADTEAEAPLIEPGDIVTWTYKVTNTGELPWDVSEIVIVDDHGTPADPSDDLSTVDDGDIEITISMMGDGDNTLAPGEMWFYTASDIAQDLTGGPTGVSTIISMTGNDPLDGPNGNIKTFTSADGNVNVNASAFSRDGAGAWAEAYLGAYGSGLGVTDTAEGDGTNGTHRVDNIDRLNYVLFEFDQPVLVDQTFLDSVVQDSDITVWVGTIADAFNNHVTLSDAVLGGLSSEVNTTTSSGDRWADINNGAVVGNVVVIAAWTEDPSPEDQFKIRKLDVQPAEPDGCYKNRAEVTAGDESDEDPSHYCNPEPRDPGIKVEKRTNGHDADHVTDAPLIVPGDTVTWTYEVTNTGDVDFDVSEVVVTDDHGTPGDPSDDFSTIDDGNIEITISDMGDGDNTLAPGETWIYTASAPAATLPGGPTGASTTFLTTGNSNLDGPDGNVRTFSSGGISMDARAFSRDANGDYFAAFLGAFGSGVGVTNNTEGGGGNGTHRVDNMGQQDFVVFEFDETVIADQVLLDSVVNDSDITVWIGTVAGPITVLSDSLLNGMTVVEEADNTSSNAARWANINDTNASGNVLIVAASTLDATPEDAFKIRKVKVQEVEAGCYSNLGTAAAGGVSDSDPSHYCNPDVPNNPGIKIEKSTNGIDADHVGDAPEIAPGETVTWTYTVENIGDVPFDVSEVVVTDDHGTPADPSDDFSTIDDGNIEITIADMGDGDNTLAPGETWTYMASGLAATLPGGPTGETATFYTTGNSNLDGPNGNVRTFTAGGISMNARAFSRDTNGDYSTSFLGAFGSGLGVTNNAEGSGGNGTHRVDNVGQQDFVVFEFDQTVVADQVFLDSVVGDSDITVWIGTAGGPITALSDSILNGMTVVEEADDTSSNTARWANINDTNAAGNVLVVAASTLDATPEDRFKIRKVKVQEVEPGCYGNLGTAAAGGVSDSDPSHYCNPVADPHATDMVMFEAEDYEWIDWPWKVKSSSSASGGQYIMAENGTGSYYNSAPSGRTVAYNFSLNEGGEFKIEGLVHAPNGSDNSIWIKVAGHGDWKKWHMDVNGDWTWQTATHNGGSLSYHLGAGDHTLKIKVREDGTKLDKLKIVPV